MLIGRNVYYFLNIICHMQLVPITHHPLRALQYLLLMGLVNGQQHLLQSAMDET